MLRENYPEIYKIKANNQIMYASDIAGETWAKWRRNECGDKRYPWARTFLRLINWRVSALCLVNFVNDKHGR